MTPTQTWYSARPKYPPCLLCHLYRKSPPRLVRLSIAAARRMAAMLYALIAAVPRLLGSAGSVIEADAAAIEDAWSAGNLLDVCAHTLQLLAAWTLNTETRVPAPYRFKPAATR